MEVAIGSMGTGHIRTINGNWRQNMSLESMTIEQLEKANEIYKELNVLQDFMDEQNKHCLSEWRLNFGDIEFDLKHLTGIKAMIRDFTSDKITELEKQLEEL